jgi:predicted metal-dependent HD superfamily phosphohydrolase
MGGRVAHAWLAAVDQLGGAATEAADELERRYREPHRRYHTLTHIEAVLDDCAWLSTDLQLASHARAVVTLAACAHDVVYAGRPGTDEANSADWARDRLAAAGVSGDDAERVRQLVLATAGHEAERDDVECSVLLDADLAILGAPPAAYARYRQAVRGEYAALDERVWRTGRAGVLRGLLARPVLYATEPARLEWDARARRNLTAELAELAI